MKKLLLLIILPALFLLFVTPSESSAFTARVGFWYPSMPQVETAFVMDNIVVGPLTHTTMKGQPPIPMEFESNDFHSSGITYVIFKAEILDTLLGDTFSTTFSAPGFETTNYSNLDFSKQPERHFSTLGIKPLPDYLTCEPDEKFVTLSYSFHDTELKAGGGGSIFNGTQRIVFYPGATNKVGTYKARNLTANTEYTFTLRAGRDNASRELAKVKCKTLAAGASTSTSGANVGTPPEFKSRLFPQCDAHPSVSLNCWSKEVFKFASVAVGIAAIVMISVGGVLYITSGGDPGRTGTAKKFMFNALMGVTVLVLANWFFRAVLGIWVWNLQ